MQAVAHNGSLYATVPVSPPPLGREFGTETKDLHNEVKALLHTKPPVKCHSAIKYLSTNQIHTSEIPQTANCYVCNCSRLPLPLWVGSLVWNC